MPTPTPHDWTLLLARDVAAACAATPLLAPLATQPVLAAGWLARVGVAVWVGALPLGPHAPARLRLALAAALALVALPVAVMSRTPPSAPVVPGAMLLVSEALVGLGLGLVASCVIAAAAWAGGLVGSVSGLSWADDFSVDAAEDSAGTARLAWWCGIAAFFATGGHLAVIGGLLDSARTLPVGCAALAGTTTMPLLEMVTAAPGLGLALAASTATPILAALVTFHVTAALCLRTVGFAPGSGLLQGAAALVVVGALAVGGDAWLGGFAGAAGDMIERGLEAAAADP